MNGCHVKPEQFFNLIFGYYDRYWEREVDLAASAGTNYLAGTTVPAGEVWIITNLRALNINTNPTGIAFQVISATETLGLQRKLTPGVGVDVVWSGHAYLKAGDYLRCQFEGCTLNDDLFFDIMGYKMKVA